MKTTKNMKLKSLMFTIIYLVSSLGKAQNFTWVKGSNLLDQNGTYGTINVASATNNPGAREGAVEWKDPAGNFWLFGGSGYDAYGNLDFLNDLWKYSPITNQWTWIKGRDTVNQDGIYGTMGVPSVTNNPGSRAGALGWTDASGNLWLMGGIGYDGATNIGLLNDLWRYNTTTNEWTWMKGNNTADQNGIYGSVTVPSASSNPGSRALAATWRDALGNLWLFGGIGYDNSSFFPSSLNDLWRYSITTNQWTWMKGANTVDQSSTYGTINISATANTPGSRYSSKGTADAAGNFWMFGGYGFDGGINTGDLNDLWRYNVTTNQWTWISGSNSLDQNGVYGVQGVQATSNMPGSRENHVMWSDNVGNLWVFGGAAYDVNSTFADNSNDLWRYNIAANQWTWMKGSNTNAQGGTYGTQGVPAATNIPPSKAFASGWIDATNSLWIFGGSGYDTNTNYGFTNDLWKYTSCSAAPIIAQTSSSVICPGGSATLSASGAATYTWSTNQQTNNISITPTVTTSYTVFGTDGIGCGNSAVVTQSVYPSSQVTIVSSNSLLCAGKIATLTAGGVSSFTWMNNQTAPTITINPVSNSTISVMGLSADNCASSATFVQNVAPLPTLTLSTSKQLICAGQSVTLTVNGALTYSWMTQGNNTSNTLQIVPALVNTYSVLGTDANGCISIASISQSVSACTDLKHETNPLFTLKLYPNPNSGKFTLSSEAFDLDKDRVIIFNAIGEKVYEANVRMQNTEVDVTLAKGLYHCQVVRGYDVIYTRKMIVQ